ncbi:MAG: MerR family transcriptional regulator [Deferribacteraceae bacterium]|nr:MerR family transcriptional regulator [Deferribacteraceae bacterium]
MRDVAKILDIPASTIRFWEENFPQIKPTRTSGGHRTYDSMQLEKLQYIKRLLKDEGLTIEGAKKRLSQKRSEADAPVEKSVQKIQTPSENIPPLELLEKVKLELKEIAAILK